VSADPDSAVVTVAVVAYGQEAPTARQRLARNATRLRESLAEAGFGEDQLSTTRYDIRYDDEVDARTFFGPGYRARQEFAVRVEDLDRTGEAIDAAVANGANRIEGVRFTLSEDRRQELREQALSEAMDRARSRAETVAEGGDLSLSGTRSVQTTAAVDARSIQLDSASFVTSADAGGAPTVLPRGSVTVTASVVVTYNATGA
jgi:hypothetical protein